MKQLLRNLKVILVIFLVISVGLLSGVSYHQYKSKKILLNGVGESKANLAERFAFAGSIYTADQVKLAYSSDQKRHYSEDRELAEATMHLVGDYTQNISNTIESVYQDNLTGRSRPLPYQLLFDLTGNGLVGDDIVLTIDSELSKEAYRQLSGHRGSAVVINYLTGEIVCMVSSPSTLPENVVAYEDIPDTGLFNRALLAEYKPGSTFKIVTGMSWITSSHYDSQKTVYCRGSEPLLGEGSVFENRSDSGHGDIGITDAYAYSCNYFFGQIGIDIGADELQAGAESFGFNQQFMADDLYVGQSRFEMRSKDPYSLSWQSIGQPNAETTLTVTPLHLSMIAATIANQGKMMQPHVIKYMINPLQRAYQTAKEQVLFEITDPQTCQIIEQGMHAAVQYGTAMGAGNYGIDVAGKTGTAEYQREDGNLVSNSLFMGFNTDRNQPYAVAVVLEDASGGAADVGGKLLATASRIEE